MRILKLEAENIKRLVAIEITPNGDVVEITGKNRQGKTSILDAIWWAIAGANHIQSTPIRDGENEARIFLDLGSLKVTRRFKKTEDGAFPTSIVVETEDGSRFQSPQKVLDKLIGALSFDPLEFTRMKTKDQMEILKRFVPDFDFDAVEIENKQDFDTRTDVNREIKKLQARLDEHSVEDLPTEKIDVEDLIDALEEGGRRNEETIRIEQNKENCIRRGDDCRKYNRNRLAEIEDLKEKIKELGALADQDLKDADEADKAASAINVPKLVDLSEIRQDLNKARENNQQYEIRAEYESNMDEMKQKQTRAEQLTKAIDVRNDAKRKAIAKAQIPVDGLSLEEGVVTLNNVPFDQASDAEQLQASIAIASAMNPKLRVIRVRDGSLMDEDLLKQLYKFAAAEDFQIWVERVENSGTVGFVIKDGTVVHSPEIKAPTK